MYMVCICLRSIYEYLSNTNSLNFNCMLLYICIQFLISTGMLSKSFYTSIWQSVCCLVQVFFYFSLITEKCLLSFAIVIQCNSLNTGTKCNSELDITKSQLNRKVFTLFIKMVTSFCFNDSCIQLYSWKVNCQSTSQL